jgi:DNA-binding NtrC family response regulator
LVVDDNIDIANIIKNALEKDGHKVRVFDDPLLALEYFKSNTKETAVVISDARMPGMNGIELLANIKNVEPKVKAMIMTAFDVDTVKLEIQRYDYEIVELFQKPFTMGNLRQRVKKHLTKEKIYQ